MEGIEDAFQAQTEAFIAWLKTCNATISDKISIQDLRESDEGRGVVANSDLEEDELLFSIPRSTVLSAPNSSLSTKLPTLFEDLDPWLSLILTMIYEYIQGPGSKWKPYFDILPREFDTLMFWSEDELVELQASAVKEKIGKESADATFKEQIIPVIRTHEDIFFGNLGGGKKGFSDADLLSLAHRMGSLIMAYAFDIEPADPNKEADEEGYVSEEEDEALPKGMVPLADILNADADRNNARLFYENDALTMKTFKPIKAGEQIFNDYGPLPRSDLLRRYGYITDNYAKYDVAEIPLDLIRIVICKERPMAEEAFEGRLEYLQEHDIIDTGYDISVFEETEPLENISSEFKVLIESLLLSQPDFERLEKKGKIPQADKISPQGVRMLHEIVKARIAQYPTSLDQEFTEPLPEDKRKRMAKQVRMGEKMNLRETEKLLGALVEELKDIAKPSTRSGDANGEAPANKRRKVA